MKNKKVKWTIADTKTISQYDTFSLQEWNKWIHNNIPSETKEENIRLSFEFKQTTTYYDEIIVEADLTVEIGQEIK